jgi:hypothetical protein
MYDNLAHSTYLHLSHILASQNLILPVKIFIKPEESTYVVMNLQADGFQIEHHSYDQEIARRYDCMEKGLNSYTVVDYDPDNQQMRAL